MLSTLPPIREFEADPLPQVDFTTADAREVTVVNHDGVFFVEGDWLLKLFQTVNIHDSDGLQYFEKVLQQSGVIRKLEEAGVQEGDTVSIYDFEFDFVY